ncbi:MAG: cation diffusion facilitator family transporter [Saprospiraceae bacterium]|nr:cation diffusion facilitator family transporter [Saprospiraceae bacterium]
MKNNAVSPPQLHPAEIGMQSVRAGILVNLVLAFVKGFVGFFGHSFALIADAIESLADVFTSIIVFFGLKAASKAPDEDHPYGHGRAEPLAGIVVAISLIGAAILIAIESIRLIMTPHKTPEPYTLIVLIMVVVVKELMFRHVEQTANDIGSTAVKGDAWHHRSDAITSLTAAIGITIALIGGEGYESADDWAALIASVLIVYNAVHIFQPAFHEVMDKAVSDELVVEVRALAAKVEGVIDVEKCFIRKSGFEYFVDIHIIVDGSLTVREGHKIGHDVKDFIMLYKPLIYNVLTHIEPNEFHF